MTTIDKAYFEEYSQRLTEHLLKACTTAELLGGTLLKSVDIDAKWDEMAPEYFGDAVKEFNAYPEFVLAAAGFLGMGIAHMWDKDWATASVQGYEFYHDDRGFDYMDEFIVPCILEADETAAKRVNDAMKLCSATALSYLRHEAVEPGSISSYKLVLATIAVMFRIGEALELYRLGYKFERVNLS